MTLGKKLFWCFGGSSLLCAALGLFGWFGVTKTLQELETSVQITAKKLALGSDLRYAILTIRFSERGTLVFGSIHAQEKVALNEEQLNKAKDRLADDIVAFRPLIQDQREAELLDIIDRSMKQYVADQQEIYQKVQDDHLPEAIQMDATRLFGPGSEAIKAADELEGKQKAFYDGAAQRARDVAVTSRIAISVLLALALLLGSISIVIVRQASGELVVIAGNLGSGTELVSSAATEILAASQALAQGSSQQAASIEETSAASHEISAMAKRNSDHTRSVSDLVGHSEQMVEATNGYLEEMVISMEEIGQSSDKISKIIKVIDSIAFQTNILALNAAVEAARAGVAGAGFAVVADEVRSLAQRSAEAAKNTAALIDESIEKSSTGKSKVDRVVVAVRGITEDSRKIKNLIDEMTQGTGEQSRGLEQVDRALSQMEQIAQSTAANAEQSAATARSLNSQSEALRQDMSSLGAMVGA
jgi:methyl-accepting chemotaxis protein/methyl-accepting chemotaxis protein-1 (serine sensor receptor)